MNDSIYLSIQNSPRFKELVRKRERFAWILSAIMLGLYDPLHSIGSGVEPSCSCPRLKRAE